MEGNIMWLEKKKRRSLEEERKTIAYCPVVSVVGNQLSRGTPKKYQKKNMDQKIMFPIFGVGYYYSLTNNHNKDEYVLFNLSPEIKRFLIPLRGFYYPQKIVKDLFIMGGIKWNAYYSH